jgi:hypothetical protein
VTIFRWYSSLGFYWNENVQMFYWIFKLLQLLKLEKNILVGVSCHVQISLRIVCMCHWRNKVILALIGDDVAEGSDGVVEVTCFRACLEIQSRIARQNFRTPVMEWCALCMAVVFDEVHYMRVDVSNGTDRHTDKQTADLISHETVLKVRTWPRKCSLQPE